MLIAEERGNTVDELKAQSTQLPRSVQVNEVNQNTSMSTPFSGTSLEKVKSTAPHTQEVQLSREQNEILDVVKRGGNVFFTGPAG